MLDKANVEQELSTIKQNVHTEQQETEMDPNPLRLLNVGLLPDNNVDSNERIMWRQQQLKKILMQSRECLSQEEVSQLSELLIGYHEVFSFEEGERGETDLIEFKIDAGDATPKSQTYRRIPFAARQEIANQLEKM